MYVIGVFFVFSCLILGVPAPPGHSLTCKQCHNVKDPSACHHHAKCHEACRTQVTFQNGQYLFTYGCGEGHEACPHHPPDAIGKRDGHQHGDKACSECCYSTGCESHLCSKYLIKPTTMAPTMAPTTPDNGCRNYESSTFQCQELEKYQFCTDTASVAYAIAHEKCAKYCGFCNEFGTIVPKPVTTTAAVPDTTMTIAAMTTTEGAVTPVVVAVNITAPVAPDACVDNENDALSCAEVQQFGFCSPDSGSGFGIAKLTCRKTCQLC